jgi:hypothetical protein
LKLLAEFSIFHLKGSFSYLYEMFLAPSVVFEGLLVSNPDDYTNML